MKKYLDLKLDKKYEQLKQPAQIIKNGGIVVFPTETVYGIGTNGLNGKAVRKLFDVKKRPLNKPISLLVNDINMINSIAKDINELEYEIIKHFFPGPLTIILKKKEIVPNIVTANQDTVGVRIPDCAITRKLIEYAEVPIAAPSANISGNASGIKIQNIINDFGEKVDFYIDSGESKIAIASTIVQVVDNDIVILREGLIKENEIKQVINKYKER